MKEVIPNKEMGQRIGKERIRVALAPWSCDLS